MPEFDPYAYAISVQRVTEDGQTLFRATVREFPDLVDYGQTPEEAFALAIESIETLAKMAHEDGRTLPRAIADDGTFSGRVTLRMTKSLHHKASTAADREGVSLNTYLVSVIAEAIGTRSAARRPFIVMNVGSIQGLPVRASTSNWPDYALLASAENRGGAIFSWSDDYVAKLLTSGAKSLPPAGVGVDQPLFQA
jgi:predicted RNase H-like HicB family nuclease